MTQRIWKQEQLHPKIFETSEQREPSSLLEWPSRERGRRSHTFFETSRDCDPCRMTLARPLQWKNEKARVKNLLNRQSGTTRNEGWNGRQSYANKQAALISIEVREKSRRKNRSKKPFSVAVKGKTRGKVDIQRRDGAARAIKLAWMAESWQNKTKSRENANYEVNTKRGMTTSIRCSVRTSQQMGGVRVERKKQSKRTKAKKKHSSEAGRHIKKSHTSRWDS